MPREAPWINLLERAGSEQNGKKCMEQGHENILEKYSEKNMEQIYMSACVGKQKTDRYSIFFVNVGCYRDGASICG